MVQFAKRTLMSAVSGAILIGAGGASAQSLVLGPKGLIDPSAELRYRFEFVDQDGAPRNAYASTARLRAGIVTQEVAGFSLKVEGEGIVTLGPENFNDTINGRTARPVVADPEDVLLNQAYLRWHKGKTAEAQLGRQTVNYDNQRWVGSVNWRQNDQTLDAVTTQIAPNARSFASYAYAWRVNRVFGPHSPQGIWRDNDIHLARLGYTLSPAAALVGYGYWLGLPDARALSSKTFGARLTGALPIRGKTKLIYAAEYASQSDFKRNPKDFTHHYLLLEPGIATGPWTSKLGFERLSGDGATALQTPLATLHAFNGWADKFLTTPPNGLRDLYLDVGYQLAATGFWEKTAVRAAFHDFRSTRNGLHYGREFDLSVSKPLNAWLTGTVKGARYDADEFATDTTKLWVQLDAKF